MIGVNEAKSGCGHTPGFGDVGEVFTLGDVDGDFTAFGAMFFILTALILGALLDSKSLHGGVEKLEETFGVEVVAADLTPFVIFVLNYLILWMDGIHFIKTKLFFALSYKFF